MNRFLSSALALCLGSSCITFGCTGTETGNPSVIDGAKIFLTVASSEVTRISDTSEEAPTDLLATDAEMTGVTLTFIECDGAKTVFPNLGLAQQSGGDEILLPEGDYCSVVVDLPEGLATPPMFELHGVRSADEMPYVVEVAREGQVTLESTQGDAVPLIAKRSDSYFLALDLAVILSSSVIAEAPATVGGEARVDEANAPELAAEITANLAQAFVLAPDTNGDGIAEPTEFEGALFVSP